MDRILRAIEADGYIEANLVTGSPGTESGPMPRHIVVRVIPGGAGLGIVDTETGEIIGGRMTSVAALAARLALSTFRGSEVLY